MRSLKDFKHVVVKNENESHDANVENYLFLDYGAAVELEEHEKWKREEKQDRKLHE